MAPSLAHPGTLGLSPNAETRPVLMLQSLAITRGNKKRAAELLGLKRTTFLEKMKRLELEDELPEVAEGESVG